MGWIGVGQRLCAGQFEVLKVEAGGHGAADESEGRSGGGARGEPMAGGDHGLGQVVVRWITAQPVQGEGAIGMQIKNLQRAAVVEMPDFV